MESYLNTDPEERFSRDHAHNWASSRQNLSSGFPTKQDSNRTAQLQRLARKLKFHL